MGNWELGFRKRGYDTMLEIREMEEMRVCIRLSSQRVDITRWPAAVSLSGRYGTIQQ